MSALVKFELDFVWVECATCGIAFGMTDGWNQRLRGNHGNFYCPSGHVNVYSGQSDADKLRTLLQREAERRGAAERDAEWERNAAKAARTQATKAKNALKRVETRVNAGVCPHCNRTFKQLAAHMKCKHAEPVDRAVA